MIQKRKKKSRITAPAPTGMERVRKKLFLNPDQNK